jgi:prepilin-type N-terminal cleavage/methylation domain-containing protein
MRKPNGFSFIEMLVVFIVIGLLAGIVIVQVRTFRERVATTTLKSDLRNFSVSQESFYYDHDIYAADPAALIARDFQMTTGTSITINEATISGWAATASHTGTTDRCYMFIPGASPVGLASEPGVIQCG